MSAHPHWLVVTFTTGFSPVDCISSLRCGASDFDRELALASFSLIEQRVPAGMMFRNQAALLSQEHQTLQRFAEYLVHTKTAEEWKECLSHAKRNFSGASPVPSAQ